MRSDWRRAACCDGRGAPPSRSWPWRLAAALFTAMLTMAATAQGRVLDQLAKGGPLAGIQVAAAAPDPSQAGVDDPTQGAARPIDQVALDRIRRIRGVDAVLPIVTAESLVAWPGHTASGGNAVGPDGSGGVVFDQLVGVDLGRLGDFPVTLSAGRFPAPGSTTQVDVTPVLLARYGITGTRTRSAVGSQIVLGAPRGFREFPRYAGVPEPVDQGDDRRRGHPAGGFRRSPGLPQPRAGGPPVDRGG